MESPDTHLLTNSLSTPFSVKNILNLTDQNNCLLDFQGGGMNYLGSTAGYHHMDASAVSLGGMMPGGQVSLQDALSSCDYNTASMLHHHQAAPPPSYTSLGGADIHGAHMRGLTPHPHDYPTLPSAASPVVCGSASTTPRDDLTPLVEKSKYCSL